LSLLVKKEGSLRILYRFIGALEILIGFTLLSPPHLWWEIRASSILALGFVSYLLYSINVAPDHPCGCIAGRTTAVSWRSISRAFLLLAFTLFGWRARHYWFSLIATNPQFSGILTAQIFIILFLSPEFDWGWLHRSLFSPFHRLKKPPKINGESISMPISEAITQLRASSPYQSLSTYLLSEDLVDYWHEDGWGFICYRAEYKGHEGIAVFAVPVVFQPDNVRGIIVDDVNRRVLVGGSFIISNKGGITAGG